MRGKACDPFCTTGLDSVKAVFTHAVQHADAIDHSICANQCDMNRRVIADIAQNRFNLTDRTVIEWREGFGANECMKTAAAGTVTLDTTAAAVVVDNISFAILQNATLGAILASKTCYWEARG